MPALAPHQLTFSTSAAYKASTAVRRLTECQSEFIRFFRRRLSRPEDAEDAFQDFCLKVIRAPHAPLDDGKVDAWLRRVLRNTLTDYYRRRAVRQRLEAAYEAEAPELVVQPVDDPTVTSCCCLERLVPTLRPDYATIIRRIDLEEEPRERIAADLGLSLNNVGVRLHRARRALKGKIEERCSLYCDSSIGSCDCASLARETIRTERNTPLCNAAVA